MKYSKHALTFDEQADLLIARGLLCDRDELLGRLRSVSYYRLSGYWYPFRRSDDSFTDGTTLETVWRRYTFDRRFRLVVLDAIERIEVCVRTELVYLLAHAQYALRRRGSWTDQLARVVRHYHEGVPYVDDDGDAQSPL